MIRLTAADLHRHAEDWIAAWNRHDIEAVLAAFAPHAVFVSPKAEPITGGAVVTGIDALRDYWQRALARVPDLRFDLSDAICDVAGQCVVVHYLSRTGGRSVRACEIMRFEGGRQVYGEALYGVEEHPAA